MKDINIWHLPTEIPENGLEILLFQKSGLSHTKIFQDNRSFNYYAGLFQIVKWAYTKDIQEQSGNIERLENIVTDCYKIIQEVETRNLADKSIENDPMYYFGQIATIIKSEMED